MKHFLLTFDVEHFSVYEGPFQPRKKYFDIATKGLEKVYNMLKKTRVSATLFLEYVFAEKNKRLLNKFLDLNCEFALHCYSHDQKYATLSPNVSQKILRVTKKDLEKLFGVKIHGFRGPGMSRPSYNILKNIGIRYDSSLHPAFIPGHYNNFFASRHIKKMDGIVEVPISVMPITRLPFSWLWFRNFGLTYTKLCTQLNFIDSDYTTIYFHPWDFMDFTKLDYKYKLKKFIARKSGDIALTQLTRYLEWIKKRNIKTQTMYQYLQEKKLL